jgi:hypothetical protein
VAPLFALVAFLKGVSVMGVVRTLSWFGVLAIVLGAMGCGSDEDGNGGGGQPDATSDAPSAAVCGNGIVEEGEECDNGTAANLPGSGCEPDCTFSCREDLECDDGNPCNGQERCSTSLHRCQAGTPLEDGAECTLMLPAPPDDDAGVPDGGAEEDPELVETDAVCIAQVCARPCTADEDCNDGNPCNGEETCNHEHSVSACQPGEAPNCDDGWECTIDTCDPVENPETGCVHTLIDEDGDGYAPEELDCHEDWGGDCDDENPDINPGADRICGDGIDNNCIGTTDDVDEPIWYQDCDGDTYAASGATPTPGCNKPSTTAECIDWTQRQPTGPTNTDCDDSNPNVYPGARNSTNNGWYTRPYCRGFNREALGSAGSFNCTGYGGAGALSWDWDCDGDWARRYTTINYTSSSNCSWSYVITSGEEADAASEYEAVSKASLMSEPEPAHFHIAPICCFCTCASSGGGWNQGWAPGCGSTASFRSCTGCASCSDCSCTSSTASRMQECR